MKKLAVLVPLTDELMADAPALGQYLDRKVSQKIRWKTNEAILFGTGGAQPLGAFTSGAAVVVAKETGQAAATLNATNIAKMFARLPPESYPKSRWAINNDVIPPLVTMTLGNYPIYLPPGGLRDTPFGMILGREAMISQHAKTLGAEGDVLLFDLSYYRTITKEAGIETATSIHLYFDADVTAFRAVFRMDGEPIISAPITPANGSANLSPFVKLGAR